MLHVVAETTCFNLATFYSEIIQQSWQKKPLTPQVSYASGDGLVLSPTKRERKAGP